MMIHTISLPRYVQLVKSGNTVCNAASSIATVVLKQTIVSIRGTTSYVIPYSIQMVNAGLELARRKYVHIKFVEATCIPY